jgi:hypothetical protein
MFVLQRISDGKYVRPPGKETSYTDRLEESWVFGSRGEAEQQRCVDSETVVSVAHLMPYTYIKTFLGA